VYRHLSDHLVQTRYFKEHQTSVQTPVQTPVKDTVKDKVKDTVKESIQAIETMDVYDTILQSHFSFPSFRPGQREIINSILCDDRDTFGVLPTSTGKTLIFQLITIFKRRKNETGITIVISPLIALMIDQVQKWNTAFFQGSDGQIHRRDTKNVQMCMGDDVFPVAVMLGSAQEDAGVEGGALRGLYPVVYMAPEKLPHLPSSLVASVHFLVIDECHCISEHGNSFRPAYRQIRPFFPVTRTLALTATADPDTQKDILDNLVLNNPRIVRMSMYRPNLRLVVRHKRTRVQDMDMIREWLSPMGRTVVFGTTRAECERISDGLGVMAMAYHAGLTPGERAKIVESFVPGTVLVATNCFGLGVDIPDIRLVVHYGLPRSLLGYAQECGRAGRDGGKSTCVLFMTASDISKYNESERDVRLASEVLAWTKDIRCRHQTLLVRFGENADGHACTWAGDPIEHGCDVCMGTIDTLIPFNPVSSDDVRLLLQAVLDTGDHSGTGLPVDFLLGSKSKKLVRFRHKIDCVYNRGRHKKKSDWIGIHRQLTSQKLLREVVTTRGYVVYKLTASGRSLL
jgi:ATP-dependent DNA helicase RecQ